NGTGTFVATLKTPGSWQLVATDTAAASIAGSSKSIAVAAWTSSHFLVSAPPAVVAGVPFSVTVTAQFANNTTAIHYSTSVHLAPTDSAADMPANIAVTQGTGTFTAILKTAGRQLI